MAVLQSLLLLVASALRSWGGNIVFPEARGDGCAPGFECAPAADCVDFESVQQLAREQPEVCRFRGRAAYICCRRRDEPTLSPEGELPDAAADELGCGTVAPPPLPGRRRRHADATSTLSPEAVPPPEVNLSVMVVQGEDAAPGRWPWMALLGRRRPGEPSTSWVCGGALVSRRFVLTAAHCVRPEDSGLLLVRLGQHRLSEPDPAAQQELAVTRVLRHPNYTGSQNDLALLELAAPARLTDAVRTVCLPPPDADLRGRVVQLTGWGQLQFAGRPADVLQQARLRVTDPAACEAAYRALPAFQTSFPGGFMGTKLCASGTDISEADACQGDSGGPLVYRGVDTAGLYQLVGVVSTGAGCGNPDFPGIYTRVASYVDWIRSHVA